ncbi:hypothetical protein PV325_010483, partial [Microctonus aethiopoides]
MLSIFLIRESSRALLTACIATYTRCRTIEEYCDAFFDNSNFIDNETLISIDVAHYVKIWANFLKNKPRRIKVFYLACIGQLILCKSISDAEKIIKKILFVSRSETDGLLKNGQQTKTEKCKSALKALITDELDEYEKLCYVLDVFSDFVTSFKILFK